MSYEEHLDKALSRSGPEKRAKLLAMNPEDKMKQRTKEKRTSLMLSKELEITP